jgi:hypothetical protein
VRRSSHLRPEWLAAGVLALTCLIPARGFAQTSSVAPTAQSTTWTKPWFAVGVLSTSSLGDCTDCESVPYRHTGSLLANAGWSLNRRTDVGAELVWVASKTTGTDRIRVTFLMSSLQFRPWTSRGFFLKAGAGMAFVHNWVLTHDGEDDAFRSKAFALHLGAGWEWRIGPHWGAQVLGAHHVGALGDLETSERTVENVMGNFWSVGAAIVIR